MITDPKKTIAAILAKQAPAAPDAGGEPDAGDDADAGLETACSDLLAAQKAGDASGMARAFKSMFTMMKSAPEEDVEPDGDEAAVEP